jgi:hypothetical protein
MDLREEIKNKQLEILRQQKISTVLSGELQQLQLDLRIEQLQNATPTA